jgi:hypothetical protein
MQRTARVFFPKDVTQILPSLCHAPLALNTGSARQGRGKKTLTVILLLSVFNLKYYNFWNPTRDIWNRVQKNFER